MMHSVIVGLMLGQRRRRWRSIKPTLSECIILDAHSMTSSIIRSRDSGEIDAASRKLIMGELRGTRRGALHDLRSQRNKLFLL